ncbi:MFS transporter [Dactylosporangium sp. CA-233914]|uniref:MFS transporter n=1 Tax=Dactylosporangium sp. CA-233914 TaxID=3239934 RepID=UPI003D95075B
MNRTPRILMFATLVNTIGNGAYLTTSALFLTRSVGLSTGQVAAGLSAAAFAGMVLSTPMGYVVDRLGAKRVQLAALLGNALCFAGLTRVHGVWAYAMIACLIAVGDATVKAANGALIAAAVPAGERVRTRAFLRSTSNAGIAIGTLAGGVPLALDSRAGYVAVLLGNAASFLIAFAVIMCIRDAAPVAAPAGGPRMVALRDRPFMAFALVDGLTAALYNEITSLALPLWLVTYTHAPVTLVSVALLINTVGCVTLQVWAARGTETAAAAIPVARRGALVVAAACVLFGLTAHRTSWLVVALVVAASVVHVLGELWLSSATGAVVFDLAPEWAQGQYQAAQQTGRQIGNLAAPPILTGLVIGLGAAGWLGVAAIFAAAGWLVPAIVRHRLTAAPASADAVA